jgi:hypothetical protein
MGFLHCLHCQYSEAPGKQDLCTGSTQGCSLAHSPDTLVKFSELTFL